MGDKKDFEKEGHSPADVEKAVAAMLSAMMKDGVDDPANKWTSRPIMLRLPDCIWASMNEVENLRGIDFSVDRSVQEAVLSHFISSPGLLAVTVAVGMRCMEKES